MYHKVEIALFAAVAALSVGAAEYDVAAYVWPAYQPDTQLGFGYLEAVKNVFGTTDKTGKEVK